MRTGLLMEERVLKLSTRARKKKEEVKMDLIDLSLSSSTRLTPAFFARLFIMLPRFEDF